MDSLSHNTIVQIFILGGLGFIISQETSWNSLASPRTSVPCTLYHLILTTPLCAWDYYPILQMRREGSGRGFLTFVLGGRVPLWHSCLSQFWTQGGTTCTCSAKVGWLPSSWFLPLLPNSYLDLGQGNTASPGPFEPQSKARN